jgi:hypothetical protein
VSLAHDPATHRPCAKSEMTRRSVLHKLQGSPTRQQTTTWAQRPLKPADSNYYPQDTNAILLISLSGARKCRWARG